MIYFLVTFLTFFAPFETYVDLEIQAGPIDRIESLICFAIPEKMIYYKYFEVENQSSKYQVPVQKVDDQLCFVLDQDLEAGKSRKYRLRPIRGKHEAAATANRLKDEVQLSLSGKEVLRYSVTEKNVPDHPDYYKRSGFIHPLRTPSGKIVTDDFPVGHTHQHALFFAWVNTTYRGDKIDFWNQQHETGTVKHKALTTTRNGNIISGFTASLEHWSLKHGVVLEEVWEVKVLAIEDYYLMDLSSVQKNVTQDTLYINQYHYGGLGIRGSKYWNHADSAHYQSDMEIFTSEKNGRKRANHTKPEWIQMSGRVENQEVGLLAMPHKDNFRAPQSVRVHPEMPYFCFAPCVEAGFYIAPGERYSSRYRLLLYDGTMKMEKAAALWQDYQEPVRVVVE